MAVMSVPKTSVYKNYSIPLWEHQIRSSLQTSIIDPVSETCRVKVSSNKKLRLGILAPDAGHHLASCFGWNNINQLLLPAVQTRVLVENL